MKEEEEVEEEEEEEEEEEAELKKKEEEEGKKLKCLLLAFSLFWNEWILFEFTPFFLFTTDTGTQ